MHNYACHYAYIPAATQTEDKVSVYERRSQTGRRPKSVCASGTGEPAKRPPLFAEALLTPLQRQQRGVNVLLNFRPYVIYAQSNPISCGAGVGWHFSDRVRERRKEVRTRHGQLL